VFLSEFLSACVSKRSRVCQHLCGQTQADASPPTTTCPRTRPRFYVSICVSRGRIVSAADWATRQRDRQGRRDRGRDTVPLCQQGAARERSWRMVGFRSGLVVPEGPPYASSSGLTEIRPGILWGGYHERRRGSRDTYPESYITKFTRIRRKFHLTECLNGSRVK